VSKKIEFPLAAAVSLVGILDSLYLVVKHVTGESVRCSVIKGCDLVLSSAYSQIWGVPLSFIGLVAYFTVFSLAILAAFGYYAAGRLLRYLVSLMLLATLWLLYVQLAKIHHFCQYCLISAGTTIILAALLLAAPLIFRSSKPGQSNID
jgi:uncharacterized membrane protein